MAHEDKKIFNYDGPDWSKPRKEPLDCILVGLSRTGTQSLKEAFRILGYGTIYDSLEMVRRHHIPYMVAALDAKYTNSGPKFGLEQFESLYGDYTAISGESVTAHAEELIELYPHAKILLSVRDDEERWRQSVLETMWRNERSWKNQFLKRVDPMVREMRYFTKRWYECMFWYDPANHLLRKYREHNAVVVRKTPPERLLVYNVKEGWEPLCQFLDKPIPNVPFPHKNVPAEHRKTMDRVQNDAVKAVLVRWLKNLGLVASIAGIVMWTRSRYR